VTTELVSFGPATEKWRTALSDSSRATYTPGIQKFQEYLATQKLYPEIRSIHEFLKALLAEKASLENGEKDFLDQNFIDRDLMKGFGSFLLVDCKLKAKSCRTYIGAVQSLGAFWKIPISTAYAELPPAIEFYEKYQWSIEKVGEFIKSMASPLYRCLGVWYIQTGLSNVDLLGQPPYDKHKGLRYGKIKEHLEAGVSPICLNLVRAKTQRFEIKFRSFIGDLGIHYFKEYLSEHEPFKDEEKIFDVSGNAVEAYFGRRAQAFIPNGYTNRNPACPSSLRTGFQTFLTDAKCDRSIIEYWMGHKLLGDLPKKYTNKSDDSWRATYREYEPALTFKV